MLKKNDPRTINAWCMYDWANSVHALVIVSSIFPVYFSATALNAQGGDIIEFLGISIKNSVLFSYTVSFSFLLVVLLIPFCTAIADYTGRKKVFMKIFCYSGAVCCGLLYFFTRETTTFAVIVFMLSLVGWSGSIVFYYSFLPEIATEDNYDRYSARGFSLGYVGSVLLLLFNLTMVLFPDWYGITDKSLPARISFLTVGVWWVLFAQIPFKYLPNNTFDKKPDGNWLFKGFGELRKVYGQMRTQEYLPKYLTAFFIFNMGVQTVMYVAAMFGANELKLPSQSLITTILLIQIVGILGSYTFSYLSSLVGNIYALMIGVVIWIGICAGAYFITQESEFYVLAAVVGMVMGGVQSLSRATYSKLIPEDTEDTASYFSFYDVTEKSSVVIGTLVYGFVEQITGSMRNSVLALMIIFIGGLLLLSRIPSQKVYRFRLQNPAN
ncbi:MFS transporter [Persicitalea jodogahamensis]|uniref:MFS transporter n=1 Tax=Persicitalea jodogahamensis TaxID=402147 RepID=A0A8J3GAP2_9BACT|nr:MFS transporter [Persicitalea jodogahamensis]GHB81334.1 MFS transporter [Persicitalea jodogahamensis]